MNTLGSVAAVIAAIREEAAAELDRLARQAATSRAALSIERDRPVDIADRDRRLAEARARAQRNEDDESWQDTLDDLQDRDRWIARVAAAARASLTSGVAADWTRAWMAELVCEAARALPAGACTIVVPAARLELFDDRWRAQLEARTGRALAVEAGALAAGCVVRLADRPIAYDNSLDARERRMLAEWRSALARVYDERVAGADGNESGLTAAAADRTGGTA
jgi:vacuolar-type H+-ATPase subunit E/Vma4